MKGFAATFKLPLLDTLGKLVEPPGGQEALVVLPGVFDVSLRMMVIFASANCAS